MTSAQITLEAIATWFPLLDLSKGHRTKIVWLKENGDWQKGESITFGEAISRLRKNQAGTIAGMLRPGILCGDFDQADGLERRARAIEELETEAACYYFGGPSGRPGHAHLWVISEGTSTEDLTEILEKHGADVRGQKGNKAIRLPGTPNREGMCSSLEGDVSQHLHALRIRTPKFTEDTERYTKEDGQSFNRSAAIQAHALELVWSGLGLGLAIKALNDAQPIGLEKLNKRQPNRKRRYIRDAILSALQFVECIRAEVTQKDDTIDQEIARWEHEATARIQESYPARLQGTGIRMAKGIAALAKQSGKTRRLGISCRELADHTGMTAPTAAAHLKTMASAGVLEALNHNVGDHSKRYRLSIQSVSTGNNHQAAPGACPSDCQISLHFEESDLDCFGGASARLRVYDAIRQGLHTVKAISNALRMTGASIRNHVRQLTSMGLVEREGHTLKIGEVTPREYAEAIGKLGHTERRRTLHRIQREGYTNHLLRNGLGHLTYKAKRRAKPARTRTLTPYPVEIEAAPAAPAQRDWMNLGERMNA